jgi:class 3 adenylate cyclase/tetratricopeptide (TPR) repeat protein
VTVCGSCAAENRAEARFCDTCGAPLVTAPARAEERKVVSVLFADLVGSTAAADGADPEDVRATLAPYHERVKREIERFGGTVEKFVGDAVMAVFGAPVAHEDDAERAVLAGLRVLEACEELGVQARAAVNTGEALVSLGARPEAGEALVAGDVVNTAARLQGAAPAGSLVAGEVTYRSTRDTIAYDGLPAVAVKGKAEPVALWLARGPRGSLGVDIELRPPTPFVGRGHEVALLRETHARTLRDSTVQLVTITGEPGVGKTRLVTELRHHVDDLAEIVYWRQGRCLPYGEGITYWALAEIVKAHAGVLESDGPEQVREKLSHVVSHVAETSDRDWLVARLEALLGAEGAGGTREESFSAWRTFLEEIAASRPLVLVVEDLHWADAALVEFLEHLVDWTSGVPLLVVCTARPELYERHTGWGGGKRNSTTIALSPLDSEETSHLLARLLDQAVLPVETQALLLERAGGNPLYAEEFVRMLRDRGLLRRGTLLADEIPVPHSVQALISARLDTLPPERKAVLQDAAVLGKVFWRGAVAAMGARDPATVAEALNDLVRKELVRPARVSSVEGETELSFWHAAIRDVAYGQIPREARAEKHRAAAQWIEGVSASTGARHELLAYHYEQAFRLASAAGRHALAAELLEPTVGHLLDAGDRAYALDPATGAAFAQRALDLVGPDHPLRPRALALLGRTMWVTGNADFDLDEVERLSDEARRGFRALGDVEAEGSVLADLGGLVWSFGQTERAGELIRESIDVLEPAGDSDALAAALASLAFFHMVDADPEPAVALAERAIAVARAIGTADRGLVHGLQVRGGARCDLGDAGGLDDLRASLRISLDQGHVLHSAVSYVNLADYLWAEEGPEAGLAAHREGIELCDRRGLRRQGAWGRAETLWMLFELGRWDELLAVGDEVARSLDESEAMLQPQIMVDTFVGYVGALTGDLAGARSLATTALTRARATQTPQVFAPALGVAATLALLDGDPAAASSCVREYCSLQRGGTVLFKGLGLPEIVRAAVATPELEAVERLVAGANRVTVRVTAALRSADGAIAEARGRGAEALAAYRDAAARWSAFGYVLEHGLALVGAGRCGGTAEELREGETLLAGLGLGEAQARSASAL